MCIRDRRKGIGRRAGDDSLSVDKGSISIWLDDENVSTATVNTAITDGQAIITLSLIHI